MRLTSILDSESIDHALALFSAPEYLIRLTAPISLDPEHCPDMSKDVHTISSSTQHVCSRVVLPYYLEFFLLTEVEHSFLIFLLYVFFKN